MAFFHSTEDPFAPVYSVSNIISYRLWWDESNRQVYFQVTHQDLRTINKNRGADDKTSLKYTAVDPKFNKMWIGSWSYPDITQNHVALRGCSSDLDNHIRGRHFSRTGTDPFEYMNLVHELINLWATSEPVQAALGRVIVEPEQLGLFEI